MRYRTASPRVLHVDERRPAEDRMWNRQNGWQVSNVANERALAEARHVYYRASLAGGIDNVNWVVEHISIEIDVPASIADRIPLEEATFNRVVKPRAVEVETRLFVELAPGEH